MGIDSDLTGNTFHFSVDTKGISRITEKTQFTILLPDSLAIVYSMNWEVNLFNPKYPFGIPKGLETARKSDYLENKDPTDVLNSKTVNK